MVPATITTGDRPGWRVLTWPVPGFAQSAFGRQPGSLHGLDDDAAASLCYSSLAELLQKRGQTQQAEAEAQEALNFARASQDPQMQGQALIALAQIRHSSGDFAGADQLFTQALQMLDASNAHEIAAAAYSRYGKLLEDRGDITGSLSAIKKALEHQRQGKRGDLE